MPHDLNNIIGVRGVIIMISHFYTPYIGGMLYRFDFVKLPRRPYGN